MKLIVAHVVNGDFFYFFSNTMFRATFLDDVVDLKLISES